MPSETTTAGSVATKSVALIGARGHVGRELIDLVAGHPSLGLTLAASRELAGQPVGGAMGDALSFVQATPEDVASAAPDIVILATPNAKSRPWIEAAEGAAEPPALIIDVSADHRFDDGWAYGLTELNAEKITAASRISNPGCYATAMQLALAPLVGQFSTPAYCFGVSGYSGAGSTPSERNDPVRLKDSVLPYQLSGHLHEREVARHLGAAIRFAPSVAPFFRGIVLTAMVQLDAPTTPTEVKSRYQSAFGATSFVRYVGDRMPVLGDVVGTPNAIVGGLHVDVADPTRVGVVCVIDNLLKGAASQAIQNINLALGLPETTGLAK